MTDILKDILGELRKGITSSENFEGANIVLYTKDKNFFLEGETDIRKVVDRIKKRIELRADEEILLNTEKTENFIRGIIHISSQ